MQTPLRTKHKVLNSTYSPFTPLTNSKVSTMCDFQRKQSNSLSRKRFQRRREESNDSLRRLKTSEIDLKIVKKKQKQTPQNIEQFSILKGDKLFPKLSFKKESPFVSKYVKMPTDRSQNNDELNLNGNYSFNGPITSRTNYRNKTETSQINSCIMDYKMELQMKNTEFMILEDENFRFKKELKNKEVLINKLQKQRQQCSMELQEIRRDINAKLKNLQKTIQDKNQQINVKDELIEKGQRTIEKGKQQLKKAEKEIDMLKVHIEQILTKKLSKQSLQIISYRQISLQNQLNQLKNQLNLLKTSQHLLLQQEFLQIKQNLSLVTHDYQNLSIANRILTKKNQQFGVSVQKKYKSELNEIRQKIKQLLKESSNLKKQNVNLKRTIHMQSKSSSTLPKTDSPKRYNRLLANSKKTETPNKQNQSDDSFTISLSK